MEAVKKELETDIFHFYVGTSYRHCLIWENGEVVDLVQPHDVLGQKIGDKLPENEALRTMMKKSYDILVNHPINIERKKKGLNPANSCWSVSYTHLEAADKVQYGAALCTGCGAADGGKCLRAELPELRGADEGTWTADL